MWQVRTERESLEDWKRSGRPPDFQTYFRIEGALEASPNALVRDIAQAIGGAPSTAFYILTQVPHLEFRNRRCIARKLSGDEKQKRLLLAISLQAELDRAQRRN
jgi:hypothetical protein